MIALSNAVEPLRMANTLTGQTVYEWSIVSVDGQPVAASNGLTVVPDRGARAGRYLRHPVRLRRRARAGVGVGEGAGGAPAPRGAARAARRAVHRRLCTRQGGAAGQVPRHHPLGESVGAARGVPPHPAQRPAVHHRPRPLYLLRRSGAARSDAAPDRGEARRAGVAADLRAVHRRPGALGPRPAVRAAARTDRRQPREPHQGGAADGGQHREAAVAR